uniref:Uncharacterized protein n=1 Tax=Timema monikensis TaxID=170555 RepID=A0A7R9E8C7_9NEOP|nr:unnamed protein product [Timema monikensis]
MQQRTSGAGVCGIEIQAAAQMGRWNFAQFRPLLHMMSPQIKVSKKEVAWIECVVRMEESDIGGSPSVMLEAFLPSMINKNHGHFVALSSMAGLMGIANLVPYCASKYAVRGLMEAMAEELREGNRQLDVRFTTICPFIVDTGLCKKPRTRFPSLLGFVPAKKAASEIIKAMRTNQDEVSIPNGLLLLNHLLRLFPTKANHLIKDFMDSGVESHD